METPSPAAPAPSAPPETIPASIAAVNAGDFDAFDRAELAKREGKPLADVAVAPDAVEAAGDGAVKPGTADGRTVSARQQKTNDAIRAAVERVDAASAARIADLERQLSTRAPAAPRTEPAAPAAPAVPATWQETIQRPDVQQPMLTEEAFFQKFPDAPYAAYGRYWSGYDAAKDQVTAHQRADAETHGKFLYERAATLSQKLTAAKTADPDFMAKLPPALLDPARSIPLSALPPTARPTFTNVVAEAMLHADAPAELAMHLHAHPDEAQRICALPQAQWLFQLARLDGRLAGLTTEPIETTAAPVAPAAVPASPRSPITAAPPPPPTLRAAGSTSDPKASALARGDFAEYDRLDLEERMAKRTPPR